MRFPQHNKESRKQSPQSTKTRFLPRRYYLLDMDTISEIQTELSHFKAHPLVGQEQKLKVNNPKHMDKQNVFNRTCNR